MTEPPRLPKVATADDMGLRCPWCAEYVEDATISLDALLSAHEHSSLEDPQREVDGTAEAFALVVACPECAKPSMLRLWGFHDTRARLIPVRTAADAALIHGPAHG